MTQQARQAWRHMSRGSVAQSEHCSAEPRRGCCSRLGARTGPLLALLAVLVCAGLPCACAHGWIAVPAARNLVHVGQQGFYQQMSLNRWVPRHCSSRIVIPRQLRVWCVVVQLISWSLCGDGYHEATLRASGCFVEACYWRIAGPLRTECRLNDGQLVPQGSIGDRRRVRRRLER